MDEHELPESPALRRARLIALWCGVAAVLMAVLAHALGVPI
jgi:hypothetical protein